jgi:hypothetical protein
VGLAAFGGSAYWAVQSQPAVVQSTLAGFTPIVYPAGTSAGNLAADSNFLYFASQVSGTAALNACPLTGCAHATVATPYAGSGNLGAVAADLHAPAYPAWGVPSGGGAPSAQAGVHWCDSSMYCGNVEPLNNFGGVVAADPIEYTTAPPNPVTETAVYYGGATVVGYCGRETRACPSVFYPSVGNGSMLMSPAVAMASVGGGVLWISPAQNGPWQVGFWSGYPKVAAQLLTETALAGTKAMTADANYAYWVDGNGAIRAGQVRVNGSALVYAGSSVLVVPGSKDTPQLLAADATALYWTTVDNRVLAYPLH